MLFGHQDNAMQQSATQVAPTGVTPHSPDPAQAQGMNPLAVDPDTGASLPVVPADSPGPVDTPPADSGGSMQDAQSVLDQPSAPGYDSQPSFAGDPAPTSPFGDDQTSGTYEENYSGGAPTPYSPQTYSDEPATLPDDSAPQADHYAGQSFSDFTASDPADAALVDPTTNELLDIKQQALSQLGSLVGHLDQSPEEKFRTTMMLIQSTDNPLLLKDAYEAAQAIADEKVRAQALLDVVNEINYFTQQQGQASDAA